MNCNLNLNVRNCLLILQKEHSNIITNLRATNEPLLTVTEHDAGVPRITETKDDSADNGTNPRQRKKIERNTSAPLPSMLQVHQTYLISSLDTFTHHIKTIANY